jgi:uncharacterized protein
MRLFHCTCWVVLVCTAALAGVLAQEPAPAPVRLQPGTSNFTIFVRGVPAGSEQIGLRRNADGWTIVGSGRIGAPVDLLTRRLEIRYSDDWKPIEVTIDSVLRGVPQSLHTLISGTTASSQVTTGGQSTQKSDTIEPDAVLLPTPFFGAYEALAIRLRSAAEGSTVHAYAVPQASFPIRVGDSSVEKIQTPARLIEARRIHVVFEPQGLPPAEADVWEDEGGRLLRLSVPAQSLEVVREDIASVAARRVTMSRPNDEQVRILANGFSLAGTISKPFDPPARLLSAVVLVGGSGPTDRDETVFGLPLFGQLAGALADAGFLVLRYDKRGVGQSGGRADSATLADYADDLRAAVNFVDARKDVDRRQVAVLGHSEGGSVALLAAAKDQRIRALVLAATAGVTGAELNLQQVMHALDRSQQTEAEKQATVALQRKIQQAALTGSGWDDVPLLLRQQADTAWFQSFLAFDPAKVMPGLRQPILIVQGTLDTQVEPGNADRLFTLARARKKAAGAELAKVPGVNHLLIAATTGEVDEYSTLKEKRISPAVTAAVITWLRRIFPEPPK